MCWQRAATVVATLLAPQSARSFVAASLNEVIGLPADIADDAELVVSELVANAVNASATSVMITFDLHHSHLRLAVEDDADDVPALKHAAVTDDHGRGLAIVDVLTRGWGVSETAGGKEVWADIPIPTPYTSAQFPCSY